MISLNEMLPLILSASLFELLCVNKTTTYFFCSTSSSGTEGIRGLPRFVALLAFYSGFMYPKLQHLIPQIIYATCLIPKSLYNYEKFFTTFRPHTGLLCTPKAEAIIIFHRTEAAAIGLGYRLTLASIRLSLTSRDCDVVTMAKTPKQNEIKDTPIDTKEMRLSKDGSHVTVGSRVFKRTVLPSSAVPNPTEADRLLDELDEEN